MKKSFLLAAVAITALAGCTDEQFEGQNVASQGGGSLVIKMGTGSPEAITRADKTGKDAAGLLNNNFIVEGFKSEGSTTTLTNPVEVFRYYNVNYYENTENSTESNYLGIHAGAGKNFKLSERSHLDTYGKFFYTLQGQDSPHLSSGETYQFDAVRSCRLRLGTKLTQDIAENQQLYAGVAWDYEFDSEARASYRGLSTPSPSLKGGSFLWEIGWKQKDSAENHLAADLGITCWRGKQEGIDLHASFLWNY